MKHRALIAGLLVVVPLGGLASCAASYGVPPELSSERTAQDEIPSRATGWPSIEFDSTRFVGSDGAGTTYYVANSTDVGSICVIAFPETDNSYAGCGDTSMRLVGPDGITIQVVDGSTVIVTEGSELVGESLLVTAAA